jgi:hypothetical protein
MLLKVVLFRRGYICRRRCIVRCSALVWSIGLSRAYYNPQFQFFFLSKCNGVVPCALRAVGSDV